MAVVHFYSIVRDCVSITDDFPVCSVRLHVLFPELLSVALGECQFGQGLKFVRQYVVVRHGTAAKHGIVRH